MNAAPTGRKPAGPQIVERLEGSPVAKQRLEQVTWKGGADLSRLKGKSVRFRFHLAKGNLYAFWMSRDETGRSDGYVAGGGPGYTGLKDTVGRAALEAERALEALPGTRCP